MDALISIGLLLILGGGGGIALGRYLTRDLREVLAENEARRARARRARARIPNDSVQFMLVTGAMTRVDELRERDEGLENPYPRQRPNGVDL